MTIEIRELVIRAVTVPTASDPENEARDEALPNRWADAESRVRSTRSTAILDQDAIVQACVQQVMRILRQMKAR